MAKLLLSNGADPLKAEHLLKKANTYSLLSDEAGRLLQRYVNWKTGGLQFALVYNALKSE